jgi:hypothetical protein
VIFSLILIAVLLLYKKWSCGHCEEIDGVFPFKFFFYGNANMLCLSEKKKWGRVAQAMVSSLVRMSFVVIFDYLARMIVKCMCLYAVLISCYE